MPAAPKKIDDVMKRRSQEIARSSFSTILETRGCAETGAGVVIAQSQLGKKEITAHFFRPRQLKRAFREKVLHSAHDRISVLQTLKDFLAEEKAAKIAPHTLKVGDIIASTSGYNMRSVAFFRVVGIPHPRKVEVVDIGCKIISGDWTSGQAVPESLDGPIPETAPKLVYQVSMETGKPVLKTGSSIDSARLWSGNPIHIYSD